MKAIDEGRLEQDIHYRYNYLCEFVSFGADDIAAIRGAIAQFAPRVPDLVAATYEKLLSYDATARHFLPRQHGFDGPLPQSLSELSSDPAQIQFRKEHLQRYLMNLIGNAFNQKTPLYLDIVGKMHTPAAGNPEIDVPLVQMNALMGVLSDAIFRLIEELELQAELKFRLIRAWNKLLWIQNDFIVRHYAGKPEETSETPAETASATS